MDNAENTPKLLPPLAETGGKDDVTRAITSVAQAAHRVKERYLEKRARGDAEASYELRYYLYENVSDPIPGDYNDFDCVSPNNPIKPLNTQGLAAADTVMHGLGQQMPGRFTVVRVDDPEEADIKFAMASKVFTYERNAIYDIIKNAQGEKIAQNYAAATQQNVGAILFSEAYFSGGYSADMESIAMHELGHGLGLDHPHAHQKLGKFSIAGVSYFDTVMTYEEENNKAKQRANEEPISLMPADLRALAALYPLPGDEKGIAVGTTASVTDQRTMHVLVSDESGQGHAVRFPDWGLVYQPEQDTRADTLTVGGAITPENAAKRHDAQGAVDYPHASIRPIANGVEIKQPYGAGTTLLSVRPEKIVLDAQLPTDLQIDGHTQVVVPPSTKETIATGYYNSSITVRGMDNRVTMSAAEFREDGNVQLILQAGSQLHITVTDAAAMKKPFILNDIVSAQIVDQGMDAALLRMQWHKDKDNAYHLEWRDLDKKLPSIQATITLDSSDPLVHAKFQWALNQPMMVAGEAREFIKDDAGRRTITPVQYQPEAQVQAVTEPSPLPTTSKEAKARSGPQL